MCEVPVDDTSETAVIDAVDAVVTDGGKHLPRGALHKFREPLAGVGFRDRKAHFHLIGRPSGPKTPRDENDFRIFPNDVLSSERAPGSGIVGRDVVRGDGRQHSAPENGLVVRIADGSDAEIAERAVFFFFRNIRKTRPQHFGAHRHFAHER